MLVLRRPRGSHPQLGESDRICPRTSGCIEWPYLPISRPPIYGISWNYCPHCKTTRRLLPLLSQAALQWRRPNLGWPRSHRILTPHTSIFSTQFLLSIQLRMVEMTSGGKQSTLPIPHKCMSRSPMDVTHEQTRW